MRKSRMKWKWLAGGLIILVVLAAAIYLIVNPETQVLNKALRAQLGGTYIRLSDGITHYELEGPMELCFRNRKPSTN
jgi:hypothetical protein